MMRKRDKQILDKLLKVGLFPNKLYSYYDLDSEQTSFIKKLGFTLGTGDSFQVSIDNLDYVEALAEKRGLI